MTAHNYGDWVITVAAGCETNGTETRTCQNCDAVDQRAISALGHDYSETYTIDLQPTCTAKGSKSRHCSRCDSVTDATDVDALGHDFGEWEITTPATCVSTGERTRECSRCDATETQEIAVSGEHTYVNGVCSGCGQKDSATYNTEGLDFTWDGNRNVYYVSFYNGTETNVFVGETYNGYTVVGVLGAAFTKTSESVDLVSISLPNTIEMIASFAIVDHLSLTEVIIRSGAGAVNVQENAIYNCGVDSVTME